MNQKKRKLLAGALPILFVGIFTLFTIGSFSQNLKAFSSGVSGFSGESGSTCNQCHSGGIEPTVTLSGPNTVFIGDVLTYTLTVADGQALAAGMDVAVTGGVLTDTLAGSIYTKIIAGEVTHDNSDAVQKAAPSYPVYGHDGGPKCINDSCTSVPGGEVIFTFNWIAPDVPTSVTMYGAGNSVDLSGDNNGDSAGTDSLTINVFDPSLLTEKIYLPLVIR